MNRKNAIRLLALAALATFTLAPIPATAQTFPDKPLRIITPFAVGTPSDVIMRQVGEKLTRMWGQPIIIDPRPGGNNWIAMEAVKRAAPDGYTLLQVDGTPLAVQPHLYKRLPFDPEKDFELVSPMYRGSFFYVIPPNSKWNNRTDLIAAAKAKPSELTYGSWGIGSQAHLAGSIVESVGGVRMTHVPFKDALAIFTSVASGDISWALGSAGTAGALQRAQKVKFLAIAAPTRHPSFPNVPTVTEAGGTSAMEIKTWISLFAPRGTPKAVIERINADVVKAMAEPDIRDRLHAVGFEAWAGTPADVARAIEEDGRRFGAVVKPLNISLD